MADDVVMVKARGLHVSTRQLRASQRDFRDLVLPGMSSQALAAGGVPVPFLGHL